MADETAPVPRLRRIDGSISVSTGDVTVDGDLTVGGNILDGRQVRAGGAVRVEGVIQAASVVVGGDLVVAGGISGRGKGECRSGGDVTARYIVKATVEARGNIKAETEISGSEVHAGGDVLIENGAVAGSTITAGGRVRCRKIAASAGVRTFVLAGADLKLEADLSMALPQIEARRARATKIREIVAPLLQNQRNLNAAQKEKATELLFEADDLDTVAAKIFSEFKSRAQGIAKPADAVIYVTEIIAAGVWLRVADIEATIDSALAGPVSIVVRGSGAHRRLVVVNATGGEMEIKSRPVQSAGAQLIARLRGDQSIDTPAVPAVAA